MDEASRTKDKSTAKIEAYLEDFKREFWKLTRQPKFALEVLGFIVLSVYAGFTIAMYFANRDAADAAKESADTARDTLIASSRPWMTASVELKGPLTFDANGAHVPLKYRLHNAGHSPAMMVWSDEALYFPYDPQRDTQMERTRLCAETIKRSVNMGQTVFPESDLTGSMMTAVNYDTIRRETHNPGGFISGAIIVCIVYQSTLDKPESAPKFYTTGLIYDLTVVDERGSEFAIFAGKDVPLDRLRRQLYP